MNPDLNLANQIDASKLYEHIYCLQGIRHPLVDMQALSDAADYIKQEFIKIGLEVEEEPIEIDGFETPFRNIIGKLDLSNGTEGELLISGHHDTVFDSPGANDNATACAIVLETARVIFENRENLKGNFRFVSFDLEEGNPARLRHIWALGEKHGIKDKKYFTSLAYKKNFDLLEKDIYAIATGKNPEDFKAKLAELNMDSQEQKYYEELADYYHAFLNDAHWAGKTILVGSNHYVNQAKKQGREIKGIINLDTVGYTSDRKNSQTYPKGIPANLLKIITKPLFQAIPFFSNQFKAVDIKDVTVGDFASLLVDVNSTQMADVFLNTCKKLNLKSTAIYTGMTFEEISTKMPDLLRSDHAPFWQAGIPGIFIADTANFRYPYYHTGGDTIDHLDFEYITKIAQVSLLTLITLA